MCVLLDCIYIRHHVTKFSSHGDLLPGTSAPLVFTAYKSSYSNPYYFIQWSIYMCNASFLSFEFWNSFNLASPLHFVFYKNFPKIFNRTYNVGTLVFFVRSFVILCVTTCVSKISPLSLCLYTFQKVFLSPLSLHIEGIFLLLRHSSFLSISKFII